MSHTSSERHFSVGKAPERVLWHMPVRCFSISMSPSAVLGVSRCINLFPGYVHSRRRIRPCLPPCGLFALPFSGGKLLWDAARLLAYHTRALLERKCPDIEEAAALLVEAESYLIGRRLRDLEGLARELRRRIRARESTRAHAPSLPPYTASDPSAAVELADALKGAAEDLVRGFEELAGEEEARPLRRRLVEFEEHLQEAHRRLEGRDAPARAPFRAGSILGGSAAIRKVVHWIRQAAPTALPVLITGETGTGKELVARALHGESSLRRQKRPTSRIPKARVE